MTLLEKKSQTNRNFLPATILVVEDNPVALNFLVSVLKKKQYAVLTARDGIEALAVIRQRRKDIGAILLDRMMPNMDGMEVTRQVLADQELKYIPIIMQTAADKPEEVTEGIKAGVFYYLTKPINRNIVLSILSSALQEYHQRRLLEIEMKKHRRGFGLVEMLRGSCRTLDEAESMSSFLANCFPDAARALTGISELLFNAVEHGNLNISYDEKTVLVGRNIWRTEIERRLTLPEYKDKKAMVLFEKKEDCFYLQVNDQGSGFDWKKYLQIDPSRASHNHGRGIAMANIVAFDQLMYNDAGNQVTAVMKRKSKTSALAK